MGRLIIYSEVTPEMIFEYEKNRWIKRFFLSKDGAVSWTFAFFMTLIAFHLFNLGYFFSFIVCFAGYFILNALLTLVALPFIKARSKNAMDACSYTRGTQKLEVSPEGIRRFYKGAEKLYAWKDCSSAYQSKTIYAIFYRTGGYLVISKSAFKSQAGKEFFLQFCSFA